MNVGIIGCGKQSAKHIRALQKLNTERIVVFDVQPEMARELARSFEIRACKSVDELMKDESIDIVDICTPTPFHFPYARNALLSGKHVFCEKPLTVSIDEAEQLQELIHRQNRLGMVAFVYKYHPRFSRAKEAMDAGAIGALRAIYMRLGGKGSHRAWKHQAESGGGVINEMMSHMLDLLLWFMGDVAEVEVANLDNIIKSRHIDGQKVESRAEDFAIVVGRGASGAKFVVQSDLISQSYTNHIEIIGEDGCIDLCIDDSRESYILVNSDKPPLIRGKNPLPAEPTDLFELMFRDLFQSIQHKETQRKNSFQDACKLAQLFSKINMKGGLSR